MTAVPAATDRLCFREAAPSDAEFFLELVNQESFYKGIGDRGIRTTDQAVGYIEDRLVRSYRENRSGLWVVENNATREPMGISGIVTRAGLDMPDLGYGFLDRHAGLGYAQEAAEQVLRFAEAVLGMTQLCAIVSPDNGRSIRLLERLAFTYEGDKEMETPGDVVRVYRWRTS